MTLAVHRAEGLLGKTKKLADTPLFNDQKLKLGVFYNPRPDHPPDRRGQDGHHDRSHRRRPVRTQPRHGLVHLGDGVVRDGGLGGAIFGFLDYAKELKEFGAEVMPVLEKHGLRHAAQAVTV